MKVSVVAFTECMTSAVYGVLDAFGIAGRLAGRMGSNVWATHEVQLVTPGGLAVQGFGGFRMEPHASLDDAMDTDVVIVAPAASRAPSSLRARLLQRSAVPGHRQSHFDL